MERETVPDTEDYILLDKIGMGMGVYSGVYEYTQQIQEQILSIQSIQVFGAFAELQAGSLQYNGGEMMRKTTESKNSWTLFFFTPFLPHVWDSVFSEH